MTIVIHAGLKKCGSSSIHSFLSANREALRKLNIHYPGPGRPGTNLAHELQARKNFDATRSTLSDLAQYWANVRVGTLVLSSEMLEETESSAALRLREAFLARNESENFLVVLVIRDLMDIIPSIYAQKVKDARTVQPFDDFFETVLAQRRANCFETARRWAEVFGWENMRIRVLEREYLLNNDLLDDFLSILNLEPEANPSTALTRPGVSNAAPGWRVLESVRALRGGFHGLDDTHPLARAVSRRRRLHSLGPTASSLGARYGWNGDRGLYLTRLQAERCLEVYGSAISSLNRHLLYQLPHPPSLTSRGFREREFVPHVEQIEPAQLRAYYDDLWAALPKKSRKGKKQKFNRQRKHFATPASTGNFSD